jgi:hypothetical protein
MGLQTHNKVVVRFGCLWARWSHFLMVPLILWPTTSQWMLHQLITLCSPGHFTNLGEPMLVPEFDKVTLLKGTMVLTTPLCRAQGWILPPFLSPVAERLPYWSLFVGEGATASSLAECGPVSSRKVVERRLLRLWGLGLEQEIALVNLVPRCLTGTPSRMALRWEALSNYRRNLFISAARTLITRNINTDLIPRWKTTACFYSLGRNPRILRGGVVYMNYHVKVDPCLKYPCFSAPPSLMGSF